MAVAINPTTKQQACLSVVQDKLVITASALSGAQVTIVPASTVITTTNGATIDIGLGKETRLGVLAQWVPDVLPSTIANNVTIEIQWSIDGTTWYVAPSSAQGDTRTSTTTSSGADKSLISRGQVLTRYFRVQLVTTGANFPVGKIYLWYANIL